jgi:glycosyltransferase involved in cell wall biosynthesis
MARAMALRIVQLISSLDPAGGGPPVVAARLAAALAQADQQVTVAAWYDPAGRQRVERDLARVAGLDRLHWFDLPKPDSRVELLFASQARQRLEELIPQSDIVHMHGVWESVLRVGASVARQHRIPYVITPHGMLGPWALRHRKLKKQVAMALAIRRMLNGAAFIHCLNEYDKEAIEPLRLRSPTEIIANGVSFEEMGQLPQPGSFHAGHPELKGDPYVLFFSRLHPGKGLNHLADALARLAPKHPRLRLVIAGPDAGAKADFERQVASAGLTDRVHVVGPLYGPGKFTAMVDALCFALPSEHECFSMAILEALACGVPAVISEESHFPEVRDADAGFVVKRSGEAFADAIDRLLTDPMLRGRMGERAIQLVRERYMWQTVAQQAIEAYGRAIQRSGRGARPAAATVA